MTLEYWGVRPECEIKSRKFDARYLSTRKVRGRMVKYFDVVCKDEVKVNVPMDKRAIREMSTWDWLANPEYTII